MVRATALALTVLTGFSGLVYEVAWQKYVATLLGSHSEATAAVLALFLGGLSVGYALFGRVTRRVVAAGARRGEPPRLLLLYGVVEAGIGLHALLFPWLFRAVQAASAAIPHGAGGLGFALDVALTALLILPPTVLMGGTIPVLTQALARSMQDATRIHAFVYAFNTAGAFAGALAAGFVLIPWLGLERVVLAMGAVNLAAGASFGALGLARRAVLGLDAEASSGAPSLGAYATAALLVGFAAITLQTVLIRLGGLAIGSSQYTFSMVVAVFVLCIALGSFAVSALPRIPPWLLVAVQWALAALLLVLHPLLPDAPYAAHRLRSLFRDEDIAFYPYHLAVFGFALAVLIVPVGLSGATLPLIFPQLRRQLGDLGAAAGRLYAWNTVGSLLGALLGGYLLFYWLDLDGVFRVALGAVVVAATLLTISVYGTSRLVAAGLVLVPLLAAVWTLPRWEPERLAAGLFRYRQPLATDVAGADAFFEQWRRTSRVAFYDDDPNSSVAVLEVAYPDGSTDTAIVTNGKPDGSIRTDYPTMALAALIPALFAQHAERGFVIGFGTGVTVGELAALDSMQRVVVAEISPGVIEGAPLFEDQNQGALGSPRTEVAISDAYRALLRSEDRWDVIVSEPSNPWVTGVEMLFSQEFLRAARDRLRPGGVYAQWFHLYENDTAVVELVLRTYASVFEHVGVWYTLGPDLVLLGFDSDEHTLDLERVRERFERPDLRAGFARAGIDDFPALLAHEILPLGVVGAASFEGDVHTIFHPVLSHRAGRAFFRGQQANLPPTLRPAAAARGRRNSLLQRYRALRGGGLSEAEHASMAREACKTRPELCATLIADWAREWPESPARQRLLQRLRRSPPFAPYLRPQVLRTLVRLLAIEAREGPSPTPAAAQQATDHFVRHYHHGTPFERARLAEMWTRCREPGGRAGACSQGLARAEQRVGPLSRNAARRPAAQR